MNKATQKLDSTLINWRAWCKDMEMDLSKIDNMDTEMLEKVSKQVDKIKLLLNQHGHGNAYIKNVKHKFRN